MPCCAHSHALGGAVPLDPTVAYGAWGVAAQWEGGNEARWSESKKLASLDPRLRAKVVQLMQRMRALGFKPKLFYGWRGLATQARLQEGGTSWVSFSFHNAVNAQGEPAALGADIVDANVGWGEEGQPSEAVAMRFFEVLGREAKAMGLYWGGDWRKKDYAHVQLMPNSALAAVKAQSMPLLTQAQHTAASAVNQGQSLRDEVLEALEAGRQRASRQFGTGRVRWDRIAIGALGLAVMGGIAYTVTRRS